MIDSFHNILKNMTEKYVLWFHSPDFVAETFFDEILIQNPKWILEKF